MRGGWSSNGRSPSSAGPTLVMRRFGHQELSRFHLHGIENVFDVSLYGGHPTAKILYLVEAPPEPLTVRTRANRASERLRPVVEMVNCRKVRVGVGVNEAMKIHLVALTGSDRLVPKRPSPVGCERNDRVCAIFDGVRQPRKAAQVVSAWYG